MFGLALVALLAFGVLSAGAASAAEAPRWSVNGAYLGAGVSKAFTATSTSEVKLMAAGLGITLASPTGECSESGEIEGSASGSPGKKKGVVLSCKKVTVAGAEKICPVNSVGAAAGTLTTNSLKGTLVWLGATGKAAGDLLEPTSGTSWTEVEITGAECPVAGKYKVTNPAISEFLPVDEEAVTDTLAHPAKAITAYYNNETSRAKQTITHLKLWEASATLSGSFSSTLNSKEALGVSPTPLATSGWKVGGSYMKVGGTEAFSGTNKTAAIFQINGAGVTWEVPVGACTMSGNLVGGTATMSGIVLNCKEIGTAQKCTFTSAGQPHGTTVTNKLTASISGENTIGLAAESGSEWANVEIESTECPLGRTAPLTGTASGTTATPKGVEVSKYNVSFTTAGPSGLHLGGYLYPYRFLGSYDLKLNSGKSFGLYP